MVGQVEGLFQGKHRIMDVLDIFRKQLVYSSRSQNSYFQKQQKSKVGLLLEGGDIAWEKVGETFWGDRNLLCLELSDVYPGVYICKTSLKYTFQTFHFIVYKLFFMEFEYIEKVYYQLCFLKDGRRQFCLFLDRISLKGWK